MKRETPRPEIDWWEGSYWARLPGGDAVYLGTDIDEAEKNLDDFLRQRAEMEDVGQDEPVRDGQPTTCEDRIALILIAILGWLAVCWLLWGPP